MTEDKWIEKYKPVVNHLDNNAGWNGTLFETYGAELDHVDSMPDNLVWTLSDGDLGEPVISNGYSFVNRLGYFVCENPWSDGEFHDILIEKG